MNNELSSGMYFIDVKELKMKSETIMNQLMNDVISYFKGSNENINRYIESLRNRLNESFGSFESTVNSRNKEESLLHIHLIDSANNASISVIHQEKHINLSLYFKNLFINANNVLNF